MLPIQQAKSGLKLVLICFALGLFAACQTTTGSKVGTNIQSFALTSEEYQGMELIIPFDDTWQIYPEGTEEGSAYEESVNNLRKSLVSSSQLLFFGATNTETYFAQTQFVINNRPDADLVAYSTYLKKTAYGFVEAAKDLGAVETAGDLKGQLLQYMSKGVIYFELIYRVENFFLRSIISTPIAAYKNKEEFDAAVTYIKGILLGIETKGKIKAKSKKKAKPQKKA